LALASLCKSLGDELVEMENERAARRLSDERQEEKRQKKLQAPRRTSLMNLFTELEEGKRKNLKLIVKGDVQGSVEAICNSLKDIKSDKVNLSVLHSAAGPITESDVALASASDAIVIGFNIKVEGKAVSVAKREGVSIKLYSIIYELLDQVKDAMLGLLDPEERQRITGQARVKQVFKITRGRVAGCLVINGRVERKVHARVKRGGMEVYDGKVDTLRRFQDDVDEVKNGLECGIRLGDYNEYEENDLIEFYELEKIKQTL
jgi:translation initiation factor IF-2